MRTHYQNLKVSESAPPEVIKAAYRALAQKHHPDKNDSVDSKRVMQIINDAYDILSDPARRELYDERLRTARSRIPEGSAPPPRPQAHQEQPRPQEPPILRPTPAAKKPRRRLTVLNFALGALILALRHPILAILGISLAWGFIYNWSKPVDVPAQAYRRPTNSVKASAPPRPSFNEPEAPLPDSGEILTYGEARLLAPFAIKSGFGTNYLVKLCDAYTGAPIQTVFVHGGSTVEVKVPLGTFVVKYATGEKWYGYQHLFGPSTAYSKADRHFTFGNDGGRYSGYTVTLYKVRAGNLHTTQIKAGEF